MTSSFRSEVETGAGALVMKAGGHGPEGADCISPGLTRRFAPPPFARSSPHQSGRYSSPWSTRWTRPPTRTSAIASGAPETATVR